jgi:subtilisin family serine protease
VIDRELSTPRASASRDRHVDRLRERFSLKTRVLAICIAGALAIAAALGTPAAAPRAAVPSARSSSVPAPPSGDSVLVSFRQGVSPARRAAIESGVGAEGVRSLGPHVVGADPPLALRVAAGGAAVAVRLLRRLRAVAYAERDLPLQASGAPKDPSFALQWGDHNTGQAIPVQEANEVLGAPARGTPDADTGALKAWGVTQGSRSIVIAETDTGVDYLHPDLAANIWSNPGGIGGCAAGTHGFNVLTHACDPMDDDTLYGGHGTHVAGIMGALANNHTGVAGVNWRTSILPVKWLDSSGQGTTAGLIEALQWVVAVKQAGVNVRVLNDSATFIGSLYSQALADEIDLLGANNILFVTAAGNTGQSDDVVPRYPCDYDRPSEICVTASDNHDVLPTWANTGAHTIDLAAPGVSIYSTIRAGKYGWLSGGSAASPQVAGAAALILSVAPSLSPAALKADILANVDPIPALAGAVQSGGVLDICKALPRCPIALVSGLTISPRVFHARPGGSTPAGATITYYDDEPAVSMLGLLARRTGIEVATHRCVPRSSVHTHAHARTCLTFAAVDTFVHHDTVGRNRIHINGRVGRRALASGTYRLQVLPTFKQRNGPPTVTAFRIAH